MGHRQVRNQQVIGFRVLLQQRQGQPAVLNRRYLVSETAEDRFGEVGDVPFVVDEENPAARGRGPGRGGLRNGLGLCGDAGQEDPYHGAATGFAGDLDFALMRHDDAVHHRQAQPRALADFLGREKRIEQSIHDVGTHPAPRVADREGDEIAVAQLGRDVGVVPASANQI